MNNQVFIVDRDDQVKWYLRESSHEFMVQIINNHSQIREWLMDMTTGVVVINGCGKIPRSGEHPSYGVYDSISRNQFKIHFQKEQDAMAFKLVWGGSHGISEL